MLCFRYIWMFPKIVVPPNHPTLIGFSIIFTIHFGGNTPIFGNTHIYIYIYTLQGTNISPKNGILKTIFLFPRFPGGYTYIYIYRPFRTPSPRIPRIRSFKPAEAEGLFMASVVTSSCPPGERIRISRSQKLHGTKLGSILLGYLTNIC